MPDTLKNFFSRRRVIFRSLETETEKLKLLEKQEAEKRANGRNSWLSVGAGIRN